MSTHTVYLGKTYRRCAIFYGHKLSMDLIFVGQRDPRKSKPTNHTVFVLIQAPLKVIPVQRGASIWNGNIHEAVKGCLNWGGA